MANRRSRMALRPSVHSPSNSGVGRIAFALTAQRPDSILSKGRVSKLYSMAAEQDVEVEDELTEAQRCLRELKSKISTQSKKNFTLQRDVDFFDNKIGKLIHLAQEEQRELSSRLEDHDNNDDFHYIDEGRMRQYGNLFYLLQNEPRYIATLCCLVKLNEIDTLLQTVMFTLYGNQYESREEHLLLTMFQFVLAAQFEYPTEFSSLLRANTPVSRMLTTYTRRGPGQSYLKTVLYDEIKSLLRNKSNLEIRPLEVYKEDIQNSSSGPITDEMATNDPQVREKIRIRTETLIMIANKFLDMIVGSLDQVPYGIRWICKQISSLAKHKFKDAKDNAISSLIGGFFFLRFVNPAIISPQAYLIVEATPDSSSRNTLTLLAKMIQNLANNTPDAKEDYMKPTHYFVKQNREKISKFLEDLCNVPDFYEQLEMDQYMSLSKQDTVISITPNEIYNTIALLKQHIDEISPPTKEDRLHILINEIGFTSPQIPRKENKAFDLHLYNSRWETLAGKSTYFMSESSPTNTELIYMEIKSIYVQIIRLLREPVATSLELNRIADLAAKSKDLQLIQKGIKVKEMLREQVEAGNVESSHKGLVAEIRSELAHLSDLKTQVLKEIESLSPVYKTITDHIEFLKSKVDTYKVYFQNVQLQIKGSQKIKGSQNSSRKKDQVTGIGVAVVDNNNTEQKLSTSSLYQPFNKLSPYKPKNQKNIIIEEESKIFTARNRAGFFS